MPYNLDAAIRRVPDFPRPGVLFYDVTSILMDPEAFGWCLDRLVERYSTVAIDAIAAIESRGFLFGAPLAHRLRVPLILVRKKGKLPGATVRRTYALEYGEDTIEVHRSDLTANTRTLIVDDLVATGGTLKATVELIQESGSSVPEIACIIGLPFLGYLERLAPIPVRTLIDYHAE
jgi:adenine phosphoribosyltransferase